MTQWALIEADLHQFYGFDIRGIADLRAVSWRWFKVRVAGLAAIESRLAAKFAPRTPAAGRR